MGELTDLDITTEEIWDLIYICLHEIKAKDYVGNRPPEASYEQKIKGQELFAFSWYSTICKKQMYLKFTISKGCLNYVSFHEDKKTGKG